jgi:hypothetical protein
VNSNAQKAELKLQQVAWPTPFYAFEPSLPMRGIMTDKTIELDKHRGTVAQKETEIRRQLAKVVADEKALRIRQHELETQLLAAPATTWQEAAEKAEYLLTLFAATPAASDPRRRTLIAAVLADFARLSKASV